MCCALSIFLHTIERIYVDVNFNTIINTDFYTFYVYFKGSVIFILKADSKFA